MTKSHLTRDKIMDLRLRQLEHVARQLDARETKVRSARLRKEWLEAQNRANYQNEYDRVRMELGRSVIPYKNKSNVQGREAWYRRLFSRSSV